MIRNLWPRLALILLIAALAVWIDASDTLKIVNPVDGTILFERDVTPRLGLDLQGGLQVLLEADLPEGATVTAADMEVARSIMENRTNALGVSENLLQVAGERRIVGEFPGVQDAEAVLATIQQTGLLEFVNTGDTPLTPGTIIKTDLALESGQETGAEAVEGEIVYPTVMTGRDLKTVQVVTDQLGSYQIAFTLSPEGSTIFGEYTAANVGRFLTIVLDKEVISSPRIDSAIYGGEGVITGQFTTEEANAFAVQLRYGSLPIPLKIVETRIIGPTLGEDSLNKSLIAGMVGMTIVMLFMGIYYRLPGLVANVSILFYALVAFALFKYIPVTLTLAGIAGFLLSTGSALDANILIFERIKEELRNGKTILQAIDLGWIRARPSILDSNIATLITSGILWWFGSTFGATIVKGFSLTLALGVAISLFTAIFVTRSLLALVIKYFQPKNLETWFGI
ncbi:MAG TPA: protein translocase subunit SecD [Anaerolineae bacterium]|jgi:preprotein translocase subunit SecD|nr:protein translocase subunit SecD [Anaerolineae bacterium]